MPENKIKVLNKIVADQIAAGEVVERPASVVKELIENSIDAGATKIQIELEGGGTGRIRVLDNGCGLSPEEAEVSFVRHATSKIKALKDLDSVSTFGFRGEALPSIASVSKITIRSQTKNAIAGIKLTIEGGEVKEIREAGCPVGTDFEVKELFYNTPARLKFLKRESTEISHCSEAVIRLALIRPDVSFQITSNGRKTRQLAKVEKPEERVAALFPREVLAKANGDENGIFVTAILGSPHTAKAGAGSLYTYVNGRYVRDKSLLRAVTQAFAGTLDHGKYPVGFISVTLPPGSFDVNVHPQKTEVRFANQNAVYRAVSHVISTMTTRSIWSKQISETQTFETQTFETQTKDKTTNPINAEKIADSIQAYENKPNEPQLYKQKSSGRFIPPPTIPVSTRPVSTRPVQISESEQSAINSTFSDTTRNDVYIDSSQLNKQHGGRVPTAFNQISILNENESNKEQPFSSLKYIGQAKGTFLILEDKNDLVLIDQHAAHERVTFERLRKQFLEGQIKSQYLLYPTTVDLGPAEIERIMELEKKLLTMGLEITRAGLDRISIHAVPAEISDASPDRLLADMILALEQGRKGSRSNMEEQVIATMACHSSIRAGKIVSSQEVDALLKSMDKIDFAGHCPHGRPVLTRISFKEISHLVKRN